MAKDATNSRFVQYFRLNNIKSANLRNFNYVAICGFKNYIIFVVYFGEFLPI